MRLAATMLALLVFAAPAAADLAQMTEAEREAFRAEVRSYLLENPEVLTEAIAVLEERQAEAQRAADAASVAAHADALFADGRSWIGGNPEGDVTMVEFLDYRCGYCRQAHPDIADLLAEDGEIRLIVKEFPILGEQSLLASRFAIATRNVVGDEAYKQVHDALMTMRSNVSQAALERLASSLDLDAQAVFEAMEAPEVDAEIRENRELAQQLGVSGTPTFVVGDQMLRGYLPPDEMARVIAEVRTE